MPENKCPKCARGTLMVIGTITKKVTDGQYKVVDVYGCDECQRTEDKNGLPVFKNELKQYEFSTNGQ